MNIKRVLVVVVDHGWCKWQFWCEMEGGGVHPSARAVSPRAHLKSLLPVLYTLAQHVYVGRAGTDIEEAKIDPWKAPSLHGLGKVRVP